MFSNGTEYTEFLQRECERCPFYIHWEDASKKHSVCFIEERIALAGTGEKEQFPYETFPSVRSFQTSGSIYSNSKEKGGLVPPVFKI
jgi:hypothetical protein